jgi:hypothetical protein
MRKNILPVICILFISLSLHAQNSTLPDAVSKAFEQKFPKAKKVKWSSENIDDYQAEFVADSLNAVALFSHDGQWLQTGVEVSQTRLLPTVPLYIKKKYPKSRIEKVTRVENSRKDPYYEIALRKKDELEYVYFDMNGNEIASAR